MQASCASSTQRLVDLAGRLCQNLLHDESVGAIVVNYRDVSQRKATERQLEYQATTTR